MAEKKNVNAETVAEVAAEKVEIEKSQFDKILSDFEAMKAKIAEIEKKADNSTAKTEKQRKLDDERKMIEAVVQANKEAEELVEIYVDVGSMRSNENLEVNANGKQYIIPKGQTVKVPKLVKEIIENSKTQQERALGLQAKKAKEALKAENEGGI